VQSHHAPGTGRYRHAVACVTSCPDCRERQWWSAGTEAMERLSELRGYSLISIEKVRELNRVYQQYAIARNHLAFVSINQIGVTL
jgi:hypothetical protein